jgi:hypothetical protein
MFLKAVIFRGGPSGGDWILKTVIS